MIVDGKDMIIVKRVLMLLKPYRRKIALILICIIVSCAVNMSLPLLSKTIMDKGLLDQNFELIIRFVLIIFLLIVLDQGIGILETRYTAYINAMMKYTLSKDAFNHLLKLKIGYFNNKNFAEIMNNIDTDVNNISKISDRSTFFIVTQAIRVIGGIIGLLFISWKLTLVVITFIIPFKYISVKYLAKKRKKLMEKYIDYKRAYAAWYGDTIRGVKEIKLYGIERIKRGQFIKKQRSIIKASIQLDLIDRINNVSEVLLSQIATNILYILGAYMIFNFDLTIGGLFAFITYTIYITGPISGILNIGYNFTNIIPSAKRLFEFLDTEREDHGIKDNQKSIRLKSDFAHGNIRFDNVSFSYEEGRNVLKDVSFEIRKGEKIALIGTNGSGKTSITNLILRLYKPTYGKILLDGTDINKINLRDYRKLIAVVSQDVYLFNGTIKENIDVLSLTPQCKIYTFTKKSCAHEFIDKMPDKYESIIGNEGLNLSGGERQKIAMARALMKDSKILILDEATSNYDTSSEVQIFKSLTKDNVDERTIIVITHKPDILKLMDKIIMIDEGCIVDIGSHEKLYSRNVLYRNMVHKTYTVNSFKMAFDSHN